MFIKIDEQAEIDRVAKLCNDEGAVFVFGSNEAGIHGAGAAKVAVEKYGAQMGQGFGFADQSFAIPTKNFWIATLPLSAVAHYVARFLAFAEGQDDIEFAVTRIGCGLAGFEDEEIAPLFRGAPRNCHLPPGWREWNGEDE